MASEEEDWTEIDSFSTIHKPNGKLKSTKPRGSSAVAKKFYDQLHDGAIKRLKDHKSPIFTTDVDSRALYRVYLTSLPVEWQAEYNCATCRHFIRRYGGLALVNADGTLTPLFWSDKEFDSRTYKPAVTAMYNMVKDAQVVDVYKPIKGQKNSAIGSRQTGTYNHFYFDFPHSRLVAAAPRGFAGPKAAQLAEMLERVLSDIRFDSTVSSALTMLTQHQLPNADNHIAAAKYLQEVYNGWGVASSNFGPRRHNWLYLNAAKAFVGCLSQLRTGSLSILLQLLDVPTSFNEIHRKWSALTDSTVYMRPTAAPTLGSIEAAEKLFNELGLTANDMRRCFLTYADLPNIKVWERSPTTEQTSTSEATTKTKTKTNIKIFSSLLPSATPSLTTTALPSTTPPPKSISFTHLLTHILPTTTRAYLYLSNPHQTITFYQTGLPLSTPLMQWHTPTNLVSTYVYTCPFHVSTHNLLPNAWNEILGVIPAPWLWDLPDAVATLSGRGVGAGLPDFSGAASTKGETEKGALWKPWHTKNGLAYTFLLSGVRDEKSKGLALFPQWMKGELHGVRKVVEWYSNEGRKEGWDEEDVARKGGFVGGVSVSRGGRLLEDGKGGILVRTVGREGEEGVWEVGCFE